MTTLLVLTALAAHEGEEVAIILPAIMLVGAFFVLRWANQNDKKDDDASAEEDLLPADRPVGLVPPQIKTDDEVSLSIAAISRVRLDADETTR